MSNIIIELSNATAQNTFNNGDFETVFEPISIQENDVITCKNVFIDTIQQSYDQIYISQDTQLELDFIVYEIDKDNTLNNNTQNPIPKKNYSNVPSHNPNQRPDYRMYVAFTANDPENNSRYLQVWTFVTTLKKGLYTPTSLAVEITRLMSGLPSPQDGDNPDPSRNVFVCEIPNEDADAGWFFCELSFGGGIPPYVDWENFFTYTSGSRYYTGARQISLVYNNQNDNKFQFLYCHNQCYDSEGNEVVGHGGEPWDIRYFTRECGIIFLDMKPNNFWTSLGFDLDTICMKWDDIGKDHPTPTSFDLYNMTTENFLSLDDLFWDYSNGQSRSVLEDGEKASSFTRGLYASQFYTFKVLNPFIIVELLTNFNGLYLTGNDKSKFISAIVSRNYTQNNYITGYADSGITYQHKGEPFILSSIRTRILNATTKEIETDIGGNNFIILNIIKNN